MTLNFPGLFPPGKEPRINFDWIDIATGNGYVVFDGLNAKDSTGNNYILLQEDQARAVTNNTGGGEGTVVLYSGYTVASGQDADIDFDLTPFQVSRTVEGDAYVKVNIQTPDGATGVYIIARIRKWDGSSETTLVTTTSPTDAAMAIGHEYAWTLQCTVPKTTFKKGDVLRLTIELWSTDAGNIKLSHNPNDTVTEGLFTAGNTRLTLAMPFKLVT